MSSHYNKRRCVCCKRLKGADCFDMMVSGSPFAECKACYKKAEAKIAARDQVSTTLEGLDLRSKQCTKCRQTKSIHLFSRQSASRDGHRTRCKNCEAEYQRTTRQKARILVSQHTMTKLRQLKLDTKHNTYEELMVWLIEGTEKLAF